MDRLCARFVLRELQFPEADMLRSCTAKDRRDAFVFNRNLETWSSKDDAFRRKHRTPSPPEGSGMFFPLYVISYLDSDFTDREIDVQVYEDWESTRKPRHFSVSGTKSDAEPLRRDAKLCIQSFVTQLNEYGVPCRQDFGQVMISLYDVWTELSVYERDASLKRIFREEMRINELPTEERLKFKILLSDFSLGVVSAVTRPGDDGSRVYLSSRNSRNARFIKESKDLIFRSRADRLDNLGQNFHAVKDVVRRYSDETNRLESSFQRFVRGVRRVKCTTVPSSVTLSNTDLKLPIVTYVMGQKLDVSVNYWIKVALLFADRCRAAAGEQLEEDAKTRIFASVIFLRDTYFSSRSSSSTLERKASLSINYVCLFPQMIEYAQDVSYDPQSSKQVPTEIFGSAFVNNAGDCEDITHAIYMFFRAFTSSEFDVRRSVNEYFRFGESAGNNASLIELRDALIEILSEMQRISRAYIPFLVIEGVSSPNVQHSGAGGDDDDDEDDIPKDEENKGTVVSGAHGALKLVPSDYFSSCLNRWNEEHPLSKYLSSKTKRDAERNPDLAGTLPILIGEGTGILEGGTQRDMFPDERRAVYDCPLTDKIKRPLIPTNRNRSPFYKALVFGFTDEFVREFKIGKFHFCTALKSGKTGRGQLYEDFMTRKENTMVIPNVLYPTRGAESPPTVEFDEDMNVVIERVIKIKTPLPSITGPDEISESASSDRFRDSLQSTLVDVESYSKEDVERSQGDGTTATATKYNATLYYHHDRVSPLSLLRRMASSFRDSVILKKARRGKFAIISLYANENHIDEEFAVETLRFYERKATEGGEEYVVGDLKIYRENVDEDFYVYRLDFKVYKKYLQ